MNKLFLGDVLSKPTCWITGIVVRTDILEKSDHFHVDLFGVISNIGLETSYFDGFSDICKNDFCEKYVWDITERGEYKKFMRLVYIFAQAKINRDWDTEARVYNLLKYRREEV